MRICPPSRAPYPTWSRSCDRSADERVLSGHQCARQALSRERGSDVVDALFAEQDRRLLISDLSIIELGSALTKKVREREITPEKYHRALGFFCQNIITETIAVEILGEEDKAVAAELVEKYGFHANLRTLDSLQLAVMKRVAAHQLDQVLCADRSFCSLILQEGLPMRNPEESHSHRA